jgi:hemerythrin
MAYSLTPWSSEFENGVIWQDLQHRELVQSVHKLYNAILKRESEEVMQGIIAFLHGYTKNHFDMEEQYMEALHYPQMVQHVQQHRDFIQMLENFERERTHCKTLANLSLCYDLNNWTLNHIKTDDHLLAGFLRVEGAG